MAALAGALALFGMAAPVTAQAYRAEEVKKSVSQADLALIVEALGHKVLDQGVPSDIFVIAQDENGMNYVLMGTACDMNGVPGCQGVLMQARFDLPPGTTFQTLAKANLDQAALNTWADFEDKTLGFTRYVVLDNGVTMANIRENVNVLLALVEETYPIAAGEQ